MTASTMDNTLRIHLGNCSPHRQVRWTTCVVPNHIADDLPQMGTIGGMMWVRSAHRRPCGTNVYVLADVAGHQVVTLAKPVAMDLPRPAFSKMLPQPDKLGLQLRVGDQRSRFIVMDLDPDPWRTRIHLRAVNDGFIADLVVDLFPWQDIADICGRITWSHRGVPTLWSERGAADVRIEAQAGTFRLDYRSRWGQIDGASIVPLAEDLYPDAMSIPFWGTWAPLMTDDQASPDDPLVGLWDMRRAMVEASADGPVFATASAGKRFEMFGLDLEDPFLRDAADREFDRFRSYLRGSGRVHDERALANPKSTGRTGNQAPFGLWKDAMVLSDPRRLWQLRESAADVLLRCHHHFEETGEMLKHADHQSWRTWDSVTHFTGADKLGKPGTYPWGFGFGRSHMDDQHTSYTFVEAVRHFTDDLLLEMAVLEKQQTDLARAKRATRAKDAPRAGGRLLQNWSFAYWTTGYGAVPEQFLDLCAEEIAKWHAEVGAPTGPIRRQDCGPVRPAEAIATDLRVIDGGPAWVPWQSALLWTGLYCAYKAFDHYNANAAQDEPRYQMPIAQAKALMLELAETNLRYGLVRASDGLLYPLNGVLWLPRGEANPESYYTFPRPGASFGDDAYDMLVGTRGWFRNMGWPTLVTGYLELTAGSDAEMSPMVAQCRKLAMEILDGMANVDKPLLEWLP